MQATMLMTNSKTPGSVSGSDPHPKQARASDGVFRSPLVSRREI